MNLTDEQIIEIRDEHLPNQGERFDCIAFARAIEAALSQPVAEDVLDGRFVLVMDPSDPSSQEIELQWGISTGVGKDARTLLHPIAPAVAQPGELERLSRDLLRAMDNGDDARSEYIRLKNALFPPRGTGEGA